MKVEERLNRKFKNKQKGKCRAYVQKNEDKNQIEETKDIKCERGESSNKSHDHNFKGRGRSGRGLKTRGFHGTCFWCEDRHIVYDCPRNQEGTNRRNENNEREENVNEDYEKSSHS